MQCNVYFGEPEILMIIKIARVYPNLPRHGPTRTFRHPAEKECVCCWGALLPDSKAMHGVGVGEVIEGLEHDTLLVSFTQV